MTSRPDSGARPERGRPSNLQIATLLYGYYLACDEATQGMDPDLSLEEMRETFDFPDIDKIADGMDGLSQAEYAWVQRHEDELEGMALRFLSMLAEHPDVKALDANSRPDWLNQGQASPL